VSEVRPPTSDESRQVKCAQFVSSHEMAQLLIVCETGGGIVLDVYQGNLAQRGATDTSVQFAHFKTHHLDGM